MAQLAVLRVALDAEVDISVLGNVGVAGIDQVLDDVQDLLDVLRCTGLDGGLFAVQTGSILEVLSLKALGHFLHGGALLLALLDELIINIGDVGDIDDLVAAVFQIAAQGIEHDQRAGIADVDIVVNGGAADIDAVFAGHLRHKLFLLAGQGVENETKETETKENETKETENKQAGESGNAQEDRHQFREVEGNGADYNARRDAFDLQYPLYWSAAWNAPLEPDDL